MTREQFYQGQAHTDDKLYVASVFETVDGETNAFHAGTWSVFIRLQGCRVGCVYCDTKYSWAINKGGKHYTVEEIMQLLRFSKTRKVTITGGEPMEQWSHTLQDLLLTLHKRGYKISMETAGTEDLLPLIKYYPWVNLVVDYKLPSAQAVIANRTANWKILRGTDVVKFVCTVDEVKEVADLAVSLREFHHCEARMVFSPVWQQSSQLQTFIETARQAGLPGLGVGLNLQTHKFIWPLAVRDEEGKSAV